MNYEIKKKDSIYFLPSVEEWIFESFKLNLLEGILYKLILQQGSFVWTSEYTGKVLRVSGKTICRAVESLAKKEVIKKFYSSKGSKTRWILVALYNVEGKRLYTEIITDKNRGERKISQDELKHHLKGKKSKPFEETDSLDEFLKGF